MKKKIMVWMFCLIFIGLNAQQVIVLNSGSQTLSKLDLQSQIVNNSFANIGLYGNQVCFTDNELWVVNSGDNNVQKIDKDTGNVLKTIQLDSSVNPWNLIKKDNYLYISGLMSSSIYRVNTMNDEISSLYSGTSPEGMIIVGNELFVANTGFQYPDYLQGKISVINLDTFTKTTDINVSTNPQAMILGSDGNIHVMCTGNYSAETGKIEVINPNTKEISQTLSIGGYPNSIIESPDHKVYLADGMGAGFFVYDSVTKDIIYSSTNPYLPGGSKIIFDNNKKLVLKTGNWVSNSHLEYLNTDDSLLHDFSLGIGAIDLTLLSNPTATVDVSIIKPIFIETYPNPFKSSIRIKTSGNNIKDISIYNLKGEKVKNLDNEEWDGRDHKNNICANGIYFVIVKSDNGLSITKKITYLK